MEKTRKVIGISTLALITVFMAGCSTAPDTVSPPRIWSVQNDTDAFYNNSVEINGYYHMNDCNGGYEAGDFCFDTTDNRMKYYNGTALLEVATV